MVNRYLVTALSRRSFYDRNQNVIVAHSQKTRLIVPGRVLVV